MLTDEELLELIRARVGKRFGLVDRIAEVLQQRIRALDAENEEKLHEIRLRTAESQFKNLDVAASRRH
jgi:hypothetical protein